MFYLSRNHRTLMLKDKDVILVVDPFKICFCGTYSQHEFTPKVSTIPISI